LQRPKHASGAAPKCGLALPRGPRAHSVHSRSYHPASKTCDLSSACDQAAGARERGKGRGEKKTGKSGRRAARDRALDLLVELTRLPRLLAELARQVRPASSLDNCSVVGLSTKLGLHGRSKSSSRTGRYGPQSGRRGGLGELRIGFRCRGPRPPSGQAAQNAAAAATRRHTQDGGARGRGTFHDRTLRVIKADRNSSLNVRRIDRRCRAKPGPPVRPWRPFARGSTQAGARAALRPRLTARLAVQATPAKPR